MTNGMTAGAAREEMAYTTKTGNFCGTIDYIFTSPGVAVVDALQLPQDENMPEKGIPNGVWPSDHFSLCALLKLP